MKIARLISFCALTLSCAAAAAQTTGNATPASATSCVGCHGAQGEGNPSMAAPRIAGQPQLYLARQLRAYADGARNHAVMTPIAKGLTTPQIDEIARYYANMTATWHKPANLSTANPRGALLATQGDEKLQVQACANCHGAGGVGEPPGYPALAGQSEAYLAAAMQQWREGARKTDPSGQMPTIAKQLSEADVQAVAAYYAGLPPPAPLAQRTNAPRGSTLRPVTPAKPATGTGGAPAQPKGTGVEQGSPTTGGTQGPGGAGSTSGKQP